MKHILFTKLGFDELKEKLESQILKRPQAVKTLARAREMGDLSENGLYKAARFELSGIDREIRFLKNLIKYGKVESPSSNELVQFGHLVTFKTDRGEKQYRIVGEYEANPKDNKISYKSPLGSKLIGKKIGENFEVNTPSGILKYTINSIS